MRDELFALVVLVAVVLSIGCTGPPPIAEPAPPTRFDPIDSGGVFDGPIIDRPDGVDPPDEPVSEPTAEWLEAIGELIREALRQLGPAPERIREPLRRALQDIGRRARQ